MHIREAIVNWHKGGWGARSFEQTLGQIKTYLNGTVVINFRTAGCKGR